MSYTLNEIPLLNPTDYPDDFVFQDADCKYLAEYLYVNLNNIFYPFVKGNIIKSVRLENDPLIPIKDYPVLKVYKNGYQDRVGATPYVSTKFTITFAVAYTQRSKVAGVGSAVADEIRKLLKNGSLKGLFQLDEDVPLDVAFDDFINNENAIYKYATVTCNIFVEPPTAPSLDEIITPDIDPELDSYGLLDQIITHKIDQHKLEANPHPNLEGPSGGGESVNWTNISTSTDLVSNRAYNCVGFALQLLTLPTTANSSIGDYIYITSTVPSTYRVVQRADTQIQMNDTISTLGLTGSITPLESGSTIKLVYIKVNLWFVIYSSGNFEVT